jgi:putative membrane protein
VAAYLLGLRAVGKPQGLRPTRAQVTWYMSGVAVLYAGAGTPIHDLAEERLFSIHMTQHMLFSLVAPPMMLLGIPDWLLRPLLRPRGMLAIARILTAPLFALGAMGAVTVFTHIPEVLDYILLHHYAHFGAHMLLVGASFLMWWPVFSPLPELPRLSVPFQMGYLFVQSFVPTVLASFITFSEGVWYEFYANAPRTWGISAREDQMIAGLIMKLAGGVIIWFVIAVVFFQWVGREERKDRDASLRWEDVEDELTRMGLTHTRTHH